ncbi:anti-sigma factor [Frankia sp. AgB32]|uniref:anti-sigma factor family protein n=1 Tax=Frankia sp. AgB32 TaxID=631119 RepID=UPI00200D6591|nr:zf-HC2 domain-containing protein [Frankia sp. AgB32]MCK9893736.1 zf-HC2 domain-containing protein [Frankia sp. AgB32]
MTEHLGDRVSPLIDHQLDHDARDRALAHLAGCARCQAEVAELRRVKGLLVAMEDPAMSGALVARLCGIGAETGPPARPGERRGAAATRAAATRAAATRAAATRAAATRAVATRAVAAAGPAPGGSARPGGPSASDGSSGSSAAPPPEAASAPGRSRLGLGLVELPVAPNGRPHRGVRLRRGTHTRSGGPPRGPRAGSARPSRPGRPGVGPSPDSARGRSRRPSPPRLLSAPKSSVRRTLLGSAALLVLAVTGAAMTDNGGNARPGGSVAVPTVSSVVAPGQPTGGSLRLIPMFTPVRVSLRR